MGAELSIPRPCTLLVLTAVTLGCSPSDPDPPVDETEPCADPIVARFTAQMDLGPWGWAAGVGSYGLVRGRCMNDPEVAGPIQAWLDDALAEPLTPTHVNHGMLAWALLDAEGIDFDPAIALAVAEYLAYEHPTIPDNGALVHAGDQVWVDTMFMAAPLLARVGVREGEPDLIEAAVTQILAHAELLQDPDTGLFFHAWDYSDAQEGLIDPNLARARWGRGNAWAALGAAEVLRAIPPDTERWAELEAVLATQLEAVLALQDSAGGWHTLLDDPGTYLESSATAGLALGLAMAIDLGLVGAEHREAVAAARGYLDAQRTEAGGLLGTSSSTAASRELDKYGEIASDEPRLWGQGLYLALLGWE
ncbi:MAG: glycoside hydrolase family 88 protein [Enhygromyxa sp.]